MASVVDLDGILSDIQTLFETANATTTASPRYLSEGLTDKVNFIGSVHPTIVPLQQSFYPFVTCYVANKRPKNVTIAIDQLNAKRQAEINIDIVGATHLTTRSMDLKTDNSSKDCMRLMENIEYVLRTIPNINGKVTWQSVSDVMYYDSPSNDGYLRAGILSLKGIVFY